MKHVPIAVAVCSLLAPGAMVGASVGLAGPAGATGTCTTISTSHGMLTAAIVDPSSPVTGTVMPTGCDIGVYFAPGQSGTVDNATISGFAEYGVYNEGGTVNVTDSKISDIGDTPFDGAQYGIGVYFLNPNLVSSASLSSPATGTISGNTISRYQKGGITVNGAGSTASVTGNTVTGLGPVSFIAQNGIQFGFGASSTPLLSGNDVSGNIYTQNGSCAPSGVGSCVGVVSTGILFYDASPSPTQGTVVKANHVYDNQANVTIVS